VNTERKIVTLCGSTRFKEEFFKVTSRLQFEERKIVLLPLEFSHYEDKKLDNKDMELLDDIHKSKIDMSDSVFIIDVKGYVGESTKKEIEYAKGKGKEVRYYSREAMD